MNILGLSLSADTHASLLIDGEIKSCVGEERLARIKNYTGFPYRAIEEVLKLESISPSEIDLVTFFLCHFLLVSWCLQFSCKIHRPYCNYNYC